MLHIICAETARLTGGGVSIALLEDERLVIRAAVGSIHVVVGREMASSSIARTAIDHDEAILCDDLLQPGLGDHELAHLTGTRSVAAAPLYFAGSPIGSIVATHAVPGGFDASVPRTLQLMASLASVAVNRSSEFSARRALAQVVDSSEDAIIGQTLDGVMVSWNAGAERMLGWTVEEAAGSPIELIVPLEARPALASRRASIARGLTIAPFETTRVTKDGNQITVSLGLFPIRDERGAVIGVSAIARDITAQKSSSSSSSRRRKWRRSGASPAASPTTSTTCSP